MKRIILIAIALTVICSENGYAFDKDGNSVGHDTVECRDYLEEFATAKFTAPNLVRASNKFVKQRAWIYGYISAYNAWVKSDSADILEELMFNQNDVLRFLG